MSKIAVGMSGGVDSSVAAYLLKEAGHEVVGLTMQIWQDDDPAAVSRQGGCCGFDAVNDARRVADLIGIPFYVLNFKSEFREHVIDYFVKEYLCGRTPNPCIACNRYVKWEALLRRSLDIEADYIATGHYARISQLSNGRYAIREGAALAKDQTYALYNLTQTQLAQTLFPLGEYSKDQVRQIARNAGLPVASKPDSQEICFVDDGDYAGYIDTHRPGNLLKPIPNRQNNFIDMQGQILGHHKGIEHYTIGQRKGLGLSAGHPVYVVDIRPQTNEVVVGENSDLFTYECIVGDATWMSAADLPAEGYAARVKIRYNHAGQSAKLYRYTDKPESIVDDGIRVVIDSPVRAVAPGQAAVFYDGEYILGGGVIIK
jgi:tRNA-specific 2-thiouridylase